MLSSSRGAEWQQSGMAIHGVSYNLRSRAYSEKCGYVLEATIRNNFVLYGKLYDVWIMTATRETWNTLWVAFQKKYGIETFEEMLKRHGNWPRERLIWGRPEQRSGRPHQSASASYPH